MAFDVNAIDYILKPIRLERIQKCLEKLKRDKKVYKEDQTKRCSIKSFGNLEVLVEGNQIRWNRAKTKELFAYLLQWEGHGVTKYKLCEELWPQFSQEKALAHLQTSVWAIRKCFKDIEFSGIQIEYHEDRYFLKVSDVEWDVRRFNNHYNKFKKTGDLEEGRKASEYYKGDYLDGEDWIWADIFRESYKKDNKGLL